MLCLANLQGKNQFINKIFNKVKALGIRFQLRSNNLAHIANT
jgi:hypothetical protein